MPKSDEFIYDYTFVMDYGRRVKVVIDYEFNDVDGVESISRFPHMQRRSFAVKLLQKYGQGKFHHLTDTDIDSPFARKLVRLFNGKVQVYWLQRPQDTVLILTGFVKLFQPSLSSLCSNTVNGIRLYCR